jgi:hypothetical protein
MGGETFLLLEHDDLDARKTPGELTSDGQSEDPSTDYPHRQPV